MTLRIDWVQERVRVMGEFRSEHVHQVKAELDRCQSPVALDLEEVGHVDVEAIRFLNSCEAAGVFFYYTPFCFVSRFGAQSTSNLSDFAKDEITDNC